MSIWTDEGGGGGTQPATKTKNVNIAGRPIPAYIHRVQHTYQISCIRIGLFVSLLHFV